MISRSEGIMIRSIKFRERSLISKVYTAQFGYHSFITNDIRRPGSAKSGFFLPLNLLDMTVYYNEMETLNRIQQMRVSEPLESLYQNFIKRAVALFLSEVLDRVLTHEGSRDDSLFRFIWSSIRGYDRMEAEYHSFHLQFLVKLIRHMGFHPKNFEGTPFSGNRETFSIICKLEEAGFDHPPQLTRALRFQCLEDIIRYYRDRLEWPYPLKSLKVLYKVFEAMGSSGKRRPAEADFR